jgi:5'-nucleotidase
VPIITTNGNYKYVGRLVVNFDKEGHIISVDPTSGPVRVAGDDCDGTLPCNDAVAPDPEVQANVVEPVKAYVASLANNIIASSAVALEGRRSPGVRTQETNLGNLIADSLLWQANQLADDFGVAPAQVALQNGGGIRNDSLIPAGDISELTTFSIAPFLNFVSIVPNIPPVQFKEILENAVSKAPTADGRFAQIGGFSVVYDPAGTPQVIDVATGAITQAGTRVVEIRLDDGTYLVQNGAVVAGAPAVNVATIDFLANGGDQYPFNKASFTRLGVTYQQALSNYIVNGLNGQITTTDYPEGGAGRITTGSIPTTLAAPAPVASTPTTEPTAEPTTAPTGEPTPTDTPTPEPTTEPTAEPTTEPTSEPTPTDTPTPEPTTPPTAEPTTEPTSQPAP